MIDLTNLAVQGRAYSGTRAWEPQELEALLTLERERGLMRSVAADYIRNGIMTVEDYDKAQKAAFKPKTMNDAVAAAEASLKDHSFATHAEAKKPTKEAKATKGSKK